MISLVTCGSQVSAAHRGAHMQQLLAADIQTERQRERLLGTDADACLTQCTLGRAHPFAAGDVVGDPNVHRADLLAYPMLAALLWVARDLEQREARAELERDRDRADVLAERAVVLE